MHGEIMIQDQRAKAAVLGNGGAGKGTDWLKDMRPADKNKGDNYVVISLWFVISLIVPYDKAPTTLLATNFFKLTE